MQHYLSIRAKPLSDIIVDIFGNIINLSGKNYIVFGTHKLPYRKKGVAPSPPPLNGKSAKIFQKKIPRRTKNDVFVLNRVRNEQKMPYNGPKRAKNA